MSETLRVIPVDPNSKGEAKYFAFQIRGWTDFDPMDKSLATIAEGIQEGGGFLTAVEVLKVASEISKIEDEEVRECFENLRAAKRLIQKANELPARMIEELRAALRVEHEAAPNRNLKVVNTAVLDDPAQAHSKRWP